MQVVEAGLQCPYVGDHDRNFFFRTAGDGRRGSGCQDSRQIIKSKLNSARNQLQASALTNTDLQ